MTTPEDDNTPRILIVEDDERLAMLTQDYLVKNGLEVAIETDGNRAIRRIVNEQPDMVVLDVMLPGISGIKLAEAIRSQFPQIPVLLMTGSGTCSLSDRLAADSGVVLLRKPFIQGALDDAIEGLVPLNDLSVVAP